MGQNRRRIRRAISLVVLIVSFLATGGTARAQDLNLDVRGGALEEALDLLKAQARIDIVYAARLVAGVTSTCTYRGSDPADALRCLLEPVGLQARWVGGDQYVIVASGGAGRASIGGFVRDGSSGLPLAGTHVYLPEYRQGVITNRTGYFTFPSVARGPYRLRLSYVGYRTVDTLVVASTAPSTFELHQTALLGSNVIVEAPDARPGESGLMPGIESPSMARLERLPASLGGRDLLESLTWFPGIRRSGEVTGGMLIRGSGADQNLYLLDGAPVYHPWHAFSLISTFQTGTFRSVRLYRGAFPAEFGGRLSAVLDAELSDGRGSEPTARAALNTHSARFLIETPITSRSSFMLGGRRSYVDKLIGREHPVSDEFGRRDTLRTGYYFFDWTAKLVFRPDSLSRVSVTSYSGRDDLDLRLPFDLSLDLSSWLRPTDLLFEVGESWTNRVVSARYERLLSPTWYLTATAWDSRYDAREAAFLRPTISANVLSDYEVGLRDLGVRLDADYYRSIRTDIRLGAQVVRREFDSRVDATIQYNPGLTELLRETSSSRVTELSGWAQGVWRATESVRLVTGLRAVAFGSDRLTRLEPRVSVQWALHPQLLVLRGSATRNYQYLHRIRDRHSYLYDLVSSRWIPSGGDTAPAKGTEYSLALESRPADVHLRTAAYIRRQEGILLPRDEFQLKDRLAGPGIEVGTLLGQYVSGQGRASGLEMSMEVERPRWLATLAMTAERSRTRARLIGEEEFRASRFDVPVSLRSYAERRLGKWTVGLGVTARSGYPITVPVARYELTGPAGDEPVTYLYRPDPHNGRLPVYHRVDTNISRTARWGDARWRFQLQVYNVFNYRNVIDRIFEPTESGVTTQDRRGLPLLPLFEVELIL